MLMMASSALREDLKCSICLNIYSEPTTLPCGHTFCMKCISKTFQNSSHRSCPECRYRLPSDMKLNRNTKMCCMVEHLTSNKAKSEKSKGCSYCDGEAEKLCLDCETPLCNVHLEKHKNTLHVLSDLNTTIQSRKCPVHHELFKYYCTEDGVSICPSCGLIGDHRLHRLEKLSDLCDQEKSSLKMLEDLLTAKRTETVDKIDLVKNHKKNIVNTTESFRNLVTLMIGDIKKELEDMEHQVLCNITSQEEQIVEQVSQVIKILEGQISELSSQIKEIQDLYEASDPLIILERRLSNNDKAKALLNVDNLSVRELDTGLLLVSLHSGIRRFTNSLPLLLQKRGFHSKDATASLLPLSQKIEAIPPFLILDGQNIDRPRLVFSASTLSSGQHYWEMETSESPCWAIGVSYSQHNDKALGYDAGSWCLILTEDKQYKAVHDGQEVVVMPDSPLQALAVYLEYETGIVSFYQLSSSTRHLCSMHAKFSQPLYIAMYVEHDGWIKIRI